MKNQYLQDVRLEAEAIQLFESFVNDNAELDNLQTLCRPCNCSKGMRL